MQIVSESFFELFVFLSQGGKFHVEFGVVFFLFFQLLSQFFFSFFAISDGGIEASLFFFGFGDIGLQYFDDLLVSGFFADLFIKIVFELCDFGLVIADFFIECFFDCLLFCELFDFGLGVILAVLQFFFENFNILFRFFDLFAIFDSL